MLEIVLRSTQHIFSVVLIDYLHFNLIHLSEHEFQIVKHYIEFLFSYLGMIKIISSI